MTWVLVTLAVWLLVSMPLALLVARAIRMADRETTASEPAEEQFRSPRMARPDVGAHDEAARARRRSALEVLPPTGQEPSRRR